MQRGSVINRFASPRALFPKQYRTTSTRHLCTKPEKPANGVLALAQSHPFAFQVGVATVKTMGADLMAQMVVEKKSFSEVDWKRNFLFMIFGAGYLGCFQGVLMINLYGRWFPTMHKFAAMPFKEKLGYTAGLMDAGKMVLFDVLVHLPFIYFPCYYITKEFIFGKTWDATDWVCDGISKWRGNLFADWEALLKVWTPADCIQFVLPMWIRMPFRHCVSFFWTAYVSFTRT
jgi:hypothetical protein